VGAQPDRQREGLPYYSQLMTGVETEIKFSVDDLEALARRLEGAGFHLDTPRTFERNVLYDTPERLLRARTEIVRIRFYGGKWTLTHKRVPDDGPGEDRHKHRLETETGIDDGAALAEVFRSIGLVPAFRYEKWRSEWSDGAGHCVVDETPIGNFAELEGEPEWIDRVAKALGVSHSHYMILSYGRLFEQWKEEHQSSAEHLTFDEIGAEPAKR
jgi:adenylate cyclase class 2